MIRKEYKKKVSDFFNFKSPKVLKLKAAETPNVSQQKLTTDGELDSYSNSIVNTSNDEQSSMASTSTTASHTQTPSRNDSAIKSTPTNKVKSVAEDMATKKRDVIIIGAGLSGKYGLVLFLSIFLGYRGFIG